MPQQPELLEVKHRLSYSKINAGKKPSLSLKFKTENEPVVTVPPKTVVASEISKEHPRTKVVLLLFPFRKHYKAGLIVDGFNGPKTKSALLIFIKQTKNN
ncbi:hypothetical protein [Peribacillus aracenensis]|uniref:hypothetical protein n=1 Tax=Peribacillus aracenensis TaxID=2976708 RepID=UPI0021A4CEB4|nr:hypothetical protein [Peribacillus sp. BBB004]